MNELIARIKYNLLCLFAVDESWDMGADLSGSIFPLGGFWVNERGVFNTHKQATENME